MYLLCCRYWISEFEAKGPRPKPKDRAKPKGKLKKLNEIPKPTQPKQGMYIEIVCIIIVIFVVSHCSGLNDYKNDYDYPVEIRCIVIVIFVVIQSTTMTHYKSDYDYAFVFAHIQQFIHLLTNCNLIGNLLIFVCQVSVFEIKHYKLDRKGEKRMLICRMCDPPEVYNLD